MKKNLLKVRYLFITLFSMCFRKNGYFLRRKLLIGAAIISLISVSCSSRRNKPTCYYMSADNISEEQTNVTESLTNNDIKINL